MPKPMRVIALEEHFLDPGLAGAARPGLLDLSPNFFAAYAEEFPGPEVLQDLGEGRLREMDETGISMQVLSCLFAQQVPAEVAVDVVRGANDRAAAAVRAHPERFRAFAALPTAVPDDAAAELDRCVSQLGFVGALIGGRTDGDFLDAERFDPILARAAALEVPIYLHPGIPPRAIAELNYGQGLAPLVTARLQTTAWGWHQETAVHLLHLVMAGVFDRHPGLQVILGHWGETVPFFLARLHKSLPRSATKLERTFREYFTQNVHVTPSGMFEEAQLQYCVRTLPIDRILFATDHPFVGARGATEFLERADLPEDAKRRIAHGNAERLLRIEALD